MWQMRLSKEDPSSEEANLLSNGVLLFCLSEQQKKKKQLQKSPTLLTIKKQTSFNNCFHFDANSIRNRVCWETG